MDDLTKTSNVHSKQTAPPHMLLVLQLATTFTLGPAHAIELPLGGVSCSGSLLANPIGEQAVLERKMLQFLRASLGQEKIIHSANCQYFQSKFLGGKNHTEPHRNSFFLSPCSCTGILPSSDFFWGGTLNH